jgi:pyruvate, orthophosphate dikinase
MTRLGVPVPPGFTVTTAACNAYLDHDRAFPPGMWEQELAALARVEAATGKKFGDPAKPLLVSCRSGAKFSMPGMMDTVLNIGLNDAVAEAMAEATGDPRFVYDAYRRLVQMFGCVVMGIDDEPFEEVIEEVKAERGLKRRRRAERRRVEAHHRALPEALPRLHRQDFPQDPSSSSSSPPAPSSTAGSASAPSTTATPPASATTSAPRSTSRWSCSATWARLGHGRRLHPQPGRRREGALRRLPAERPGRGRRRRHPQHRTDRQAAHRDAQVYEEFITICDRLEHRFRDMQDVEFTSSAASCGCCRPATASAPRAPRSRSPST